VRVVNAYWMSPDDVPGIARRDFVKAAVAIGGANALTACLSREGATEDSEFPRGPGDLSALPDRQHAWGRFIVHDAHDNTVLPQHQLLLFLNYRGSGTPTDADRERVEETLRTLERAYQRGTAGDISASINPGLLFTLGYSRDYFDRFDADLPADLDLQRPETVLEAVGEDPEKADHYDALLVLTADFGSILLAVEEALFGDRDRMNGVPMPTSFDEVFEKADRRAGVVGKGLPAQEVDVDAIPEHAPLSMGFKSGFKDSLPAEDRVTIESGPFAGGTTQAVSRLLIDVERWYDNDRDSRVHGMFSPHHDVDDVGETGEPLGNDSGITEEMTTDEAIAEGAERTGCVGHTAKTARARDENFEPRILRRSEAVATDLVEDGKVGFNFTSVQRGVEDFVKTRKAMNPDEYDVDVDDPHHGIVDYLTVVSRATFLLPPRRLRSLPSPNPEPES